MYLPQGTVLTFLLCIYLPLNSHHAGMNSQVMLMTYHFILTFILKMIVMPYTTFTIVTNLADGFYSVRICTRSTSDASLA